MGTVDLVAGFFALITAIFLSIIFIGMILVYPGEGIFVLAILWYCIHATKRKLRHAKKTY